MTLLRVVFGTSGLSLAIQLTVSTATAIGLGILVAVVKGKRGRPPKTFLETAAADYHKQLIRESYKDPGSSLGRGAYLKELLRNKELANQALSNASAALLRAKTEPGHGTNHMGIECLVAALTRVSEVAGKYPQELKDKIDVAQVRYDDARRATEAALEVVSAAREEERVWIEAAFDAVTPNPRAPEPTVVWREKQA